VLRPSLLNSFATSTRPSASRLTLVDQNPEMAACWQKHRILAPHHPDRHAMHNIPTYDGNDERAVVADEQNQQGLRPRCNLVQGDVLLRRRCVWQLRTEQRVVGHASSGSSTMTVRHGICLQQISFGILLVASS